MELVEAKYLLKPQSLTTSNQVLLTGHLNLFQNPAKTAPGFKTEEEETESKLRQNSNTPGREWPPNHLLDLSPEQITSKTKEQGLSAVKVVF